jgi:hypothetical protein
MHHFAQSSPRQAARPVRPASPGLARLVKRVAQGVSVGVWLAGWAMGVQGCDDRTPVDPPPPDGGTDVVVVDPPPPPDGMGVDPLPQDGMIGDPPPPDGMVVDPLPPDGTVVDMVPPDGMMVDPLPPDGMMVDPPPPPDGMVGDPLPLDAGADLSATDAASNPPKDALARVDCWQDTSPQRVIRSRDLPLFDPPVVKLSAEREGAGIRVCLSGGPQAVSLRWQGGGAIEGEGREVLWRPESPIDQISVGVRSRGGVAVVSLRAKDVA